MKIVGVGWDSPEDNQDWADDEGFGFELWTDEETTLAVYYGAAESEDDWFVSRVTKLLDGQGTLILEYVDNVNVGTHPAQVLEDCESIFGEDAP